MCGALACNGWGIAFATSGTMHCNGLDCFLNNLLVGVALFAMGGALACNGWDLALQWVWRCLEYLLLYACKNATRPISVPLWTQSLLCIHFFSLTMLKFASVCIWPFLCISVGISALCCLCARKSATRPTSVPLWAQIPLGIHLFSFKLLKFASICIFYRNERHKIQYI